ncbi:microfibril-associated glycoprotein 4-like [Megalobrama amblycephala]|uniref:microfibril-associated glycoprotein 4-like n=1 Tax=Megalobrama amblycephala TaxID=75352 RepID=UPI0020145F6B|nr:microfibril-associated glycoprotein 4-like [Megalobrama amblycephala]
MFCQSCFKRTLTVRRSLNIRYLKESLSRLQLENTNETNISAVIYRGQVEKMAMFLLLVALIPVIMGCECDRDVDKPINCSDLYKAGQTVSGIYSIYPAGGAPVWVYCDMISDGKDEDNGGWTVFQRRMDGSINFYQPWNQYKRGFGNVESEYWLGLENMHQLTRNRKYMLRVDLEDFEGRKGFALYSSFSVDCECAGYQLSVSGFTDGGAGAGNWQTFWIFRKCEYSCWRIFPRLLQMDFDTQRRSLKIRYSRRVCVIKD